MRLSLSEMSAVAVFAALSYAGGFLLIAIPNIEIFTAIVFMSGVLLGPRNGLLVGVVAQMLYSVFNPYGMSPLPLLLAQVSNRALVGLVGGWLSRRSSDEGSILWAAVTYGVAGLLLTWLYDLMAFLSFQFMSGFSLEQMQSSFALGLPFYLIHGFGNLAIFALVLPVVLRTLKRTALLNKVRVI